MRGAPREGGSGLKQCSDVFFISAADAPIQTLPSLAAWWAALVEDLLELLQVFHKTGSPPDWEWDGQPD